MKKNKLSIGKLAVGLLTIATLVSSCNNDDDLTVDSSGEDTVEVNIEDIPKYSVGADIDDEGYLTFTDDLTSGDISIVGTGIEGVWAGQSINKDGYLYIINFDENTIDKNQITEEGTLNTIGSLSLSSLIPGSFFRYTRQTEDGDLFFLNNPDENGNAPYAIVNMESFTVSNYGTFYVPDVDDNDPLWVNALVKDDKAYVSGLFADAKWTNVNDSLITVVYDFPSMTNPTIIKSGASSGMTAGYRSDGAFLTETGDIYQCNITSSQWYGSDEVSSEPSVFVKIVDGEYDDSYVFDVSASYDEDICIWNVWYAENGIAYANIVKESDLTAWGDLSANTGTLTEIDLINKTVTPLNIPQAPYVNIFQLNCVEDGKFNIPVCINGGDANIYEIVIGGGADGFTKGASLDGENVFISSLQKNN